MGNEKRCHSQKVCIYTKKPHIQLAGKIPGSSVNWTSIAQSYPPSLAHRLANTLVFAAEDQVQKLPPAETTGKFGRGCKTHSCGRRAWQSSKAKAERRDDRQLMRHIASSRSVGHGLAK